MFASMKQSNSDKKADFRGLKCPLPVLKTRRALADIEAGGRLDVLADDPAASLDMAHFCEADGHELEVLQQQPYFHFRITKG